MFYDRLVEPKEQAWFLDVLKKLVQQHFRTSFDALFQHLTLAPGEAKGEGGGGRDGERACLLGGSVPAPDAGAGPGEG